MRRRRRIHTACCCGPHACCAVMARERNENTENVLNFEVDDENTFEVIELDQCDNPGDLTNEVCDLDLEDESDVEGGANDDSDLTVSLHDGSVFCVVLGPGDHPLAVTGGEDNRAFVWRLCDGSTVFECTGHKDSVTCVGFSYDGSLLATGDMSGILKVWSTDCWQEVWSFEVGDLEWMEWHRHAPVLCAGTTDGSVWLWKLPEGKTKMFQGPGCTTTCGALLPDGSRAAVGYEDGTLRIWDLKQGLPLHTFKGSDFHQVSLTCLSCDPNGERVLTGSLDGTARLLSPTSGKVLHTFRMEAPGSQSSNCQSDCNSVESVGFCHLVPLMAVGFLSGVIAIWDIPTHSLRHRIDAGAGVVRLRWELSSAGLLAGCLNGTVSIWDGLTGGLASKFHGHTEEVLDFALSSDASTFVTASGDGTSKTFCLRQEAIAYWYTSQITHALCGLKTVPHWDFLRPRAVLFRSEVGSGTSWRLSLYGTFTKTKCHTWQALLSHRVTPGMLFAFVLPHLGHFTLMLPQLSWTETEMWKILSTSAVFQDTIFFRCTQEFVICSGFRRQVSYSSSKDTDGSSTSTN